MSTSQRTSEFLLCRFLAVLAPAFAITAYAAQGQTLEAAIVDLQIGRGTSPIASYVALTRVKRREDLLIYRPFDRDLFTKGGPRGPKLLLQTLRGEDIDWRAIEEEFTPHSRCVRCGFSRFKDEYLLTQWNRKDKRRHCKPCMETLKKAGTPFECNVCNLWKAVTDLDVEMQHQRLTVHRKCSQCTERRQCKKCGVAKSSDNFSRSSSSNIFPCRTGTL